MSNPVLEKNLEAFFRRYPHERARLEPALRKPAPLFTLQEIELPPAPSKPPIRILLLLGIVNPVFLATVLNDKTVSEECFRLFVFENDPEFAAFCFQNADLTQVIAFEKTEWFLCHTIDSVKPALFRALKPEPVTSMMLNVQALQVVAGRSNEQEEYYRTVPFAYDETCKHVFHNHGNLDDSLLGIEVTLRNKDFVLKAPGVTDLEDHFKGCSALVVGAGPSLDANLEAIKKYNDKFVVIAADAALKPLTNAGIRVDYVTSIERLNAYQKPFFENLSPSNAELVAFPVVHPEVLAIYPGTVRIVYRNYSFYAYFEKSYPKGILRCGGSTSHLGMRLAAYMGCSRAFMIGLDSCYEEKDGLFRSHCSGTGHPDWGEFVEIGEFAKKRRHLPPMKAVNNLGGLSTTNITYYQWAKEYAEELAYIGQTMEIKNCAATGLAVDGVPYVPLEEAAKDLESLTIAKPVAKRPVNSRSWDHKILLKNFEGWLQASTEAVKECDALLAAEQIDQARFTALQYLYDHRFCVDSLFVAFVIQCCALDFFQIENKWWSYGIPFDVDQREKIGVLKERFTLFTKVLERLIKMFNEEGKDGI